MAEDIPIRASDAILETGQGGLRPAISAPSVDVTSVLPGGTINVTAGAVSNSPRPASVTTTITAYVDGVEDDSSGSSPWAYAVPAEITPGAVITFRQDSANFIGAATQISDPVTVGAYSPLAVSDQPADDVLTYGVASISVDYSSRVTGGSGDVTITPLYSLPAGLSMTDGARSGTPVADGSAPGLEDFDSFTEGSTPGKTEVQLRGNFSILAGTEVAVYFGATDPVNLDFSATPSYAATLTTAPGGVGTGGIGTIRVSSGTANPGTVYYRAAILRDATTKAVMDIAYLGTFSFLVAADVIAPTLSNPTAASSNATTLAGTVNSDEGGTLWAVATQSATKPSAAQIKAGQNNTGGAANGAASVAMPGAGTHGVSIGGLGAVAHYFHFVADDAAGNTSTVVTSTAATPTAVVANLTLNAWSQDDVTYDGGFYQVSPKEIMNLENTVGSRWAGTYKTPATDSLPGGITRSGVVVTVGSGFTGYLEGWDFTGNQLYWSAGNVRIRDCRFGERLGAVSGLNNKTYLDITSGATVYEIAHCDFIGPNALGYQVSPAIRYVGSGGASSGYPGIGADGGNPKGWVHHNKFTNLTEDAIKPTGGLIEYNAIVYDKNLNFAGQSADPHADAINPYAISQPLTIRRNFIKFSQRTDGLWKSGAANNAFRVVPNTGSTTPYQRADIYENVVIGSKLAGGSLFSAETKGVGTYVAPAYLNNWVRENAQNGLYPTYGSGLIWQGNRYLDDGTLVDEGEGNTTREAIAPSNMARVPISGTATTGKVIEARAVSADDGGAQTTPWHVVATASGSGNWSGYLRTPRAKSTRLKAQVRLSDVPGGVLQSTQYFRAGHRWDWVGQSDVDHIFGSLPQHNHTPTPETVPQNYLAEHVTAPRSLSATSALPAGSAVRRKITSSQKFTAPCARLARMAYYNFNGEPIGLRTHSVSGRGIEAQFKQTNWFKADDAQLVAAMPSNPGFVWQMASSNTSVANFKQEMLGPFIIGLNTNGTTFTPPGAIQGGTAQWKWAEFIDWDTDYPTKFITDRLYPSTYYDAIRAAIATMTANTKYTRFMPPHNESADQYTFKKGENNGTTDTGHPAQDDIDGATLGAEVWLGHAVLMTGALGNLGMPTFDTIEVSGEYVKVGWSGGDLTTPFRHLGRTRLTAADGAAKYNLADAHTFSYSGGMCEARIRNDAGTLANYGRFWLRKQGGGNWTSGQIDSISANGWNTSGNGSTDHITGWRNLHLPCGARSIDGNAPFISYVRTTGYPSDLFTNRSAYAPGWNK